MFKKFECGCIGVVTFGHSPNEKHVWCVKSCDTGHNDPPYAIYRRDILQEQKSIKLTDEQVDELMRVLADLVSDGNRLRELQYAFKLAGLKD